MTENQVLIEEGQRNTEMFFVVEGSVMLEKLFEVTASTRSEAFKIKKNFLIDTLGMIYLLTLFREGSDK